MLEKVLHRLRRIEGQVFKHLPNQDYEQNPNQWLVTTGAVDASLIRPAEILPETNRQYLNRQDLGHLVLLSICRKQKDQCLKNRIDNNWILIQFAMHTVKKKHSLMLVTVNLATKSIQMNGKSPVASYSKNTTFLFLNETVHQQDPVNVV